MPFFNIKLNEGLDKIRKWTNKASLIIIITIFMPKISVGSPTQCKVILILIHLVLPEKLSLLLLNLMSLNILTLCKLMLIRDKVQ